MSKISAFFSNVWTKIKSFFSYSETILWARIQAAVGFVLAVAGGVDWTAVTSNFANAKQALWVGIGLVANGVITEILRRRNAVMPTPTA